MGLISHFAVTPQVFTSTAATPSTAFKRPERVRHVDLSSALSVPAACRRVKCIGLNEIGQERNERKDNTYIYTTTCLLPYPRVKVNIFWEYCKADRPTSHPWEIGCWDWWRRCSCRDPLLHAAEWKDRIHWVLTIVRVQNGVKQVSLNEKKL